MHAPDAIRACICREQTMAALARLVAEKRDAYDAAQQQFQSLSSDAETARQHLNPDDAAQRDALGRLLGQRDASQDRLAAAAPPLNDAVGRYNAIVAAYNGNCSGKAYDPTVLQEVRSNPSCPPESLPPS